jgi:hypothetical protein
MMWRAMSAHFLPPSAHSSKSEPQGLRWKTDLHPYLFATSQFSVGNGQRCLAGPIGTSLLRDCALTAVSAPHLQTKINERTHDGDRRDGLAQIKHLLKRHVDSRLECIGS